jgi:hypothetical protein
MTSNPTKETPMTDIAEERLFDNRHPESVIADAEARHGPFVARVCLFSGGNDSLATAHRCRDHYDELVWVDTGTAVPGVAEFVEEAAGWLGKPLKVAARPRRRRRSRRGETAARIPGADAAHPLLRQPERAGAYAAPGEREMLRSLFPEWFEATIAPLERAAVERGLEITTWGAGREFLDQRKAEAAGPMCSDCQLRFEAEA